MVSVGYFGRRYVVLRILRGALLAGAALDLACSGALIWAPGVRRALLPTSPAATFYLSLAALPLALVGLLGLVAARDPRRYSAVALLSASGRLAAAALLALAHGAGAPPPALPLAALEAALGAAVLGTWPTARR